MKKVFILTISILSVSVFAQIIDTGSVNTATSQPQFSGVLIGDGTGFSTTSVGSNTYLVPPTYTPIGPRGIKEIKEKVYYTIIPEKPRLGQTVEIKAEMPGTPVKNAEFAWIINNKTYAREIGLNKISFLLDKKTTVTLLILTQDGNIITKEWTFDPQNTLIIWEARTYTPPFYKGKSLYTPESSLVLHAINLDVENPLTNVYANYVWKVDDRVKGEQSGVGKSTYMYKGDLLGLEPLFRVDFSGVSSFSDGLADIARKEVNGSGIMRVQTNPSAIFSYEKKPLLGVLFNKSIQETYTLTTPETTIVAYPVYYSLNSSLSGDYTWTINNTIVGQQNHLTIKKIRSNELSRLGVEIKNTNSLLQNSDISYIIDTSTKDKESETSTSGFGK